MNKIKQRIKSIINFEKPYYVLNGRDQLVDVYTKGRHSVIEYWDFIDLWTNSIKD